MSIKDQGHYLTLAKGHSDFKIKPCFFLGIIAVKLCMAIEQNQTGNGRYGCDVTIYLYISLVCS